jgi:succinyl-diaminopimelate desuccinylase
VEVDDHVVLPPLDTDVEDPFVRVVADALGSAGLEDAAGPPARFFTDASVLAGLLGSGASPVPTVVLGPGEPDQCHVADEWCSLARVDEAVEVYGELLRRWCASGR